MAVEFRCPECRAKLRVPEAPDPGDDVECPKCGHVFPAPDLDDDRPEKAAAAPEPEEKPKAGGQPKEFVKANNKRKKAKKKKTSPALLAGIVVGGLVFIGLVTALLVWYTRRAPASVEMMYYLPEDTELVTGFNVGHVQKYSGLYDTVDKAFAETPTQKAFAAFAKALGQEPKEITDYAVTGKGKTPSSAAIVLRTKKEYDTARLAKFPGAREATADGVKYYKVDKIDGVDFDNPRVFAPTNRLLVICPGDIPTGLFGKMVHGQKDESKAVPARMGAFGNKVARGTYWVMYLYGTGSPLRPKLPPQPEGNTISPDFEYAKMLVGVAGKSQGMGYKVNVGSKEIRMEMLVWYDNADDAKDQAKKWKESELAKGDDGDTRSVRWWGPFVARMGQRKVGDQMRDHLVFDSSGEVFVARTAVDTVEMKMSISNLANRTLQVQAGAPPPKEGN
jgi:predicted Zn finger-like uncharacterized protein